MSWSCDCRSIPWKAIWRSTYHSHFNWYPILFRNELLRQCIYVERYFVNAISNINLVSNVFLVNERQASIRHHSSFCTFLLLVLIAGFLKIPFLCVFQLIPWGLLYPCTFTQSPMYTSVIIYICFLDKFEVDDVTIYCIANQFRPLEYMHFSVLCEIMHAIAACCSISKHHKNVWQHEQISTMVALSYMQLYRVMYDCAWISRCRSNDE